ncbi:MAG: hypothetical protein ACYDCL_06035 [Myxococcales bacterium]
MAGLAQPRLQPDSALVRLGPAPHGLVPARPQCGDGARRQSAALRRPDRLRAALRSGPITPACNIPAIVHGSDFEGAAEAAAAMWGFTEDCAADQEDDCVALGLALLEQQRDLDRTRAKLEREQARGDKVGSLLAHVPRSTEAQRGELKADLLTHLHAACTAGARPPVPPHPDCIGPAKGVWSLGLLGAADRAEVKRWVAAFCSAKDAPTTCRFLPPELQLTPDEQGVFAFDAPKGAGELVFVLRTAETTPRPGQTPAWVVVLGDGPETQQFGPAGTHLNGHILSGKEGWTIDFSSDWNRLTLHLASGGSIAAHRTASEEEAARLESEQEVLSNLRALAAAEQASYATKGLFSADIEGLHLDPLSSGLQAWLFCPDRADLPEGREWVAGCHFAYHSVLPPPGSKQWRGEALGTTGPLKGKRYTVTLSPKGLPEIREE